MQPEKGYGMTVCDCTASAIHTRGYKLELLHSRYSAVPVQSILHLL